MVEPIERKLVFYSHLAFYPIHWQAFLHLCAHYRVRGTAIAVAQADLPLVHQQLGWVDPRAYWARPLCSCRPHFACQGSLSQSVPDLNCGVYLRMPSGHRKSPPIPTCCQFWACIFSTTDLGLCRQYARISLRRGRLLCAFPDAYYGPAWMAYWQLPLLLWRGFVLPACQRGFRQHLWWLVP